MIYHRFSWDWGYSPTSKSIRWSPVCPACHVTQLHISNKNPKQGYPVNKKEKRCKTVLAATFFIRKLILFWTFIRPLFRLSEFLLPWR
jgi:hypothetical protein